MNKILLAFFAILVLTQNIFAQQRLGHINSGNVLELMPETSNSTTKLQKLEDSLRIVLDTMATKFDKKYQKAALDVQKGILTKVQQASLEKELQEEQTKLNEQQKNSQIFLAASREKLVKPILERLNKVISDIGKEKGYSYIFDVSLGSMLFAADSTEDITGFVLEKLGIKPK